MTPAGVDDNGLFSGRVSDIEIGRADGTHRFSSLSHRVSGLSMGSGFDEDIPPFEYDKVYLIIIITYYSFFFNLTSYLIESICRSWWTKSIYWT